MARPEIVVEAIDPFPEQRYPSAQYVLVPVLEHRWDEHTGDRYWVATFPFFGFLTYGSTRHHAAARLQMALNFVVDYHRERVLAGHTFDPRQA